MKKQELISSIKDGKKVKMALLTLGAILLLSFGLFAQLGWLPNTDRETGERSGWLGMKIDKNSPSSNWNPFPEPAPPFVPNLSKEYIYAGDRMLAVEDYAQPTPTVTPTPTPGSATPTPTPTPTPTATPTPPPPCNPPWSQVRACEQNGGVWDYVTCQCGVGEEE